MRALSLTLLLAALLAACQPRVALEVPKEPITINLNVNLTADVRVRLEETAREDIKQNRGVF